MKTGPNKGRRMVLAALELPAATTTAAALVRQRQRRAGAVPPPVPKNDSERRVLEVIADQDRTQRSGSMRVPFEDGRLLRILAETIAASREMEIPLAEQNLLSLRVSRVLR
jgi:hypothetical protein